MTPDKLVAAAEARRAEFEAVLAPARVLFDAHWPSNGPPQLGVGFELNDQRKAIRVKQSAGDDPVETALVACRTLAPEWLARVSTS